MKSHGNRPLVSGVQLDLPFQPCSKSPRTSGAEPLAVRISDAVRMTGIGRSKLYELIAAGELKTVKIGRCTLVPIKGLKELLGQARERPR